MASRFALDRYHHLDSATHAKEWLIMREQFGLAPNALDEYARVLSTAWPASGAISMYPETQARLRHSKRTPTTSDSSNRYCFGDRA